jgi:hypothetical protein
VLPWFVLATAAAVGGMLSAPPSYRPWRRAAVAAALVLSFGWGVFVHRHGANSIPAWYWNHRAAAVGEEAAVKEWDHPQFLAGLTFEVNPDGTVTTSR